MITVHCAHALKGADLGIQGGAGGVGGHGLVLHGAPAVVRRRRLLVPDIAAVPWS